MKKNPDTIDQQTTDACNAETLKLYTNRFDSSPLFLTSLKKLTFSEDPQDNKIYPVHQQQIDAKHAVMSAS